MWKLFKIAELEEGMRQRGDTALIDLLNEVRVAKLSQHSENLLLSRFVNVNDPNYPIDALHIFAENKPARCHNNKMLSLVDNPLYMIAAIDEFPKNVNINLFLT